MWLAFLSTSFIVLSAVCVACGWILIRQGQRKKHMQVMVLASIFALTFFVIYMSRTIFVGNTAFGGPEHMSLFYHLFLIFHIILATVGAVMGLISLYLGYKRKYGTHKKIGPYTSFIWFATAFTGVMVFLLLYVIYPPGETTNTFRAVFGW